MPTTRVTPTGIIFADNTVLNSKYGIVPQSSSSVFLQSASPIGWTKSLTHNDKTLRVVSGTGGGSGGTISFANAFPNSLKPVSVTGIPVSGTVGNTTLTITQLPSHTHSNGGDIGLSPGGGDVGSGSGWSRNFPDFTSTGSGGSHTHPWTGTVAFSTNLDFSVQYVDIILCSFS